MIHWTYLIPLDSESLLFSDFQWLIDSSRHNWEMICLPFIIFEFLNFRAKKVKFWKVRSVVRRWMTMVHVHETKSGRIALLFTTGTQRDEYAAYAKRMPRFFIIEFRLYFTIRIVVWIIKKYFVESWIITSSDGFEFISLHCQ